METMAIITTMETNAPVVNMIRIKQVIAVEVDWILIVALTPIMSLVDQVNTILDLLITNLVTAPVLAMDVRNVKQMLIQGNPIME